MTQVYVCTQFMFVLHQPVSEESLLKCIVTVQIDFVAQCDCLRKKTTTQVGRLQKRSKIRQVPGKRSLQGWCSPPSPRLLVFNMTAIFSNGCNLVPSKSVSLYQFAGAEDLAPRLVLFFIVNHFIFTNHHNSLIWAERISSHQLSMNCNQIPYSRNSEALVSS